VEPAVRAAPMAAVLQHMTTAIPNQTAGPAPPDRTGPAIKQEPGTSSAATQVRPMAAVLKTMKPAVPQKRQPPPEKRPEPKRAKAAPTASAAPQEGGRGKSLWEVLLEAPTAGT
jgi:hypothetical protein